MKTYGIRNIYFIVKTVSGRNSDIKARGLEGRGNMLYLAVIIFCEYEGGVVLY